MAAWQASFTVAVPPRGLPSDYRARLSTVLPKGPNLADETEMWGTEQGDRIDITAIAGGQCDVLARFDMREWKPDLYVRFIQFLGAVGVTLHVAPAEAHPEEIPLTAEAFEAALRSSDASRFVANPEAYLLALPRQTDKE